MPNEKKRRDAAKRRVKRKQKARERQRERGVVSAVFTKTDIHAEIRHITELAQAGDSRIVTLGPLLLFSTRSRAAWLLDREDGFALCLCRDGDLQPVRILDTPGNFAIEWTADFEIDGERFIVHERTGRIVAIDGYPTVEIAAACPL